MVTLKHRHQNQKSIPEKNQLSMLEFQNTIPNDQRSAEKLASALRPSRGRPPFNTTFKEPFKKHRAPTLPGLSNNTRFDKLFPCIPREAAMLQKTPNRLLIYHKISKTRSSVLLAKS